MTVEAAYSKFKKNNFKIYIVICLAFAAWCVYDGYFNEEWIKEHTNPDGSPQTYLVFNKRAPYWLGVAALFFAGCLLAVQSKKIIADENELILSEAKKIPYDSVEKIDKTNFESKGYFVVTYKDQLGNENNLKLSNKNYDNLNAVLDVLVEKISTG